MSLRSWQMPCQLYEGIIILIFSSIIAGSFKRRGAPQAAFVDTDMTVNKKHKESPESSEDEEPLVIEKPLASHLSKTR